MRKPSRDNGSGSPIFVARDGVQFLELRLKRLGVIGGRILDENRVGLPNVSVVAYSDSVPLRIMGSATTDERGVYRITGLTAGPYLIRTGGAQLEDSLSLLPTYYPFASVLRKDAATVTAALDAETLDTDIQPVAGQLGSLAVGVNGCLGVAQVTLASDTGRRQAMVPCNLGPARFDALAPGEYEVFAEGEADNQKLGGFLAVQVMGAREVGLTLRPPIDLKVQLSAGIAMGDAGLIVRRRDLAGEGAPMMIGTDSVKLYPGYWELTARPPGNLYLSQVRFNGSGYRRTHKETHPDWFEFSLEHPTVANIVLSPQQARISGRVTLDGKAAIGAPVYLLATTPETRRQMNGPRATQTDANGNYRFDGLAPGSYRLLSSFEITEVTEETIAGAQSQAITIEEGKSVTQDLPVSGTP